MTRRLPTWFVIQICDGSYNEFRSQVEAREYFLQRVEMCEDDGLAPENEVKMGIVTFSGYVPHILPEEL